MTKVKKNSKKDIDNGALFRRDVVYFGIDEYGDSLLTYYKVTWSIFYTFSGIMFYIVIMINHPQHNHHISQCTDGDCVEINDMKCNRTCDGAKFDISASNYILLEVIIILIPGPDFDQTSLCCLYSNPILTSG